MHACVLLNACMCAAVSFSEAAQSKRVILLDKNFQHLQDIPVDLGPRYHQVTLGNAPVDALAYGARDIVRVAVPVDRQGEVAAFESVFASQGVCA